MDTGRHLAAEPDGGIRPSPRGRLLRGPVDPRPDALPDADQGPVHVELGVATGPDLDGRGLQRRPGRGRRSRRAKPVLVGPSPRGVVPGEHRAVARAPRTGTPRTR